MDRKNLQPHTIPPQFFGQLCTTPKDGTIPTQTFVNDKVTALVQAGNIMDMSEVFLGFDGQILEDNPAFKRWFWDELVDDSGVKYKTKDMFIRDGILKDAFHRVFHEKNVIIDMCSMNDCVYRVQFWLVEGRVCVRMSDITYAYIDKLTGLRNNSLLKEILIIQFLACRRAFRAAIEKHEELPKPLALWFIDLNKFKQINDKFGHDMGDVVLKAVADTIKKVVRSSDVVFRRGWDEYIVMFSHLSQEDQRIIEQKLQEAFVVMNQELRKLYPFLDIEVGFSIGFIQYDDQEYGSNMWDAQEEAVRFVNHADAAMYTQKHAIKARERFELGHYVDCMIHYGTALRWMKLMKIPEHKDMEVLWDEIRPNIWKMKIRFEELKSNAEEHMIEWREKGDEVLAGEYEKKLVDIHAAIMLMDRIEWLSYPVVVQTQDLTGILDRLKD